MSQTSPDGGFSSLYLALYFCPFNTCWIKHPQASFIHWYLKTTESSQLVFLYVYSLFLRSPGEFPSSGDKVPLSYLICIGIIQGAFSSYLCVAKTCHPLSC